MKNATALYNRYYLNFGAGNISGAVSGKWSQKEGTSYFTVTINGQAYKGVFSNALHCLH
jgi:hypothetical protein